MEESKKIKIKELNNILDYVVEKVRKTDNQKEKITDMSIAINLLHYIDNYDKLNPILEKEINKIADQEKWGRIL